MKYYYFMLIGYIIANTGLAELSDIHIKALEKRVSILEAKQELIEKIYAPKNR